MEGGERRREGSKGGDGKRGLFIDLHIGFENNVSYLIHLYISYLYKLGVFI